MNDHQERLWQCMIDLIQDYIDNDAVDFYNLVGKLEGALDAADIKDAALVKQWYDFWTPLEIQRALKGHSIEKSNVINELIEFKNFLIKNKNLN